MSDTPQQTPATGDMSPADCGNKLKELFPALFGAPRPLPLKLRIQADIQERAPGVFTKAVLSAFLRRYTGSHAYLTGLTKATQRFDLDGQPAGEITDEHRKAASDELTRRRDNKNAQRELEEQQRHNRATLLRDFERTTLTPANFCALKGIPVEALDGLLALARQDALENPPAADPRRGPDRRSDRRPDRRPDRTAPGRPQGRREDRRADGHRATDRRPAPRADKPAPSEPKES
ncbi:MAG: ProQ/FINO family protein [Acidobacteriota bacterium]